MQTCNAAVFRAQLMHREAAINATSRGHSIALPTPSHKQPFTATPVGQHAPVFAPPQEGEEVEQGGQLVSCLTQPALHGPSVCVCGVAYIADAMVGEAG